MKKTTNSWGFVVMDKQKNNMIYPDYVSALETVYGAPSQEAFGRVVSFERRPVGAILAYDKYFTGWTDCFQVPTRAAWILEPRNLIDQKRKKT
jgi:hypothetical protein